MSTPVRTIGAIGATTTLLGGAGSALLLALAASPAGAATTWTVDTLADGAANATDCTTPVVGSCSLRDALAAAAIGDTIQFAPALFTGGAGTITLTAGELVDDGVDVLGPGANLLTVDAAGNGRVFQITPKASGSTISGVTLTGGNVPADGGGAIKAQGSNVLTVSDSVVTGNTAGFYGGGIYAQSLFLTRSTVSNNVSNYGGGGMVATDQLVISGSTISGNSALLIGGGAAVLATKSLATVSVIDSTISGNTAQAGGGFGGYFTSGTFAIANSTLTGNSAAGQGGAIGLSGARLDISMSTITGNSSGGTDPFYSGGGISITSEGFPIVTLTGTVVAGNVAAAGGTADMAVGASAIDTGAVTANDSLVGSGVSPNATLTGTGLLRSDAPMLAPLADNGGRTLTMVPLPGSPLIDAGPAAIPPFPGNEFDQRGPGFPRIVGRTSDIGAVEAPAPPEPVVPVFTG